MKKYLLILPMTKKYAEGYSTQITNENINRVIPKCPYYKECGGCNIMHMNYAYQEEYKLNKVKEILKNMRDWI